MTRIIPREVRLNQFDQDTFRQLKGLIENIPAECFESKDVNKIAELIGLMSRWPKEQMMWVVSVDPAYFLQYKKNACAVFVIEGVTVFAYRPKYLEYPQIVDMSKLQEAASPVAIELQSKGQSTPEALAEAMKQFLSKYYGTFYGKEGVTTADFETELLKNVKYYLSRYSRHMYWHAVLGPAKTAVHQFGQIDVSMKFRIDGTSPKYLFLYSLKGVNDPIRNVILNKWKQILVFMMLFVLLLVVVACPNSPPPTPQDQYVFRTQENSLKLSLCANRVQIYYAIGGLLFLLTGLQIAGRKKPRIPPTNKKTQ